MKYVIALLITSSLCIIAYAGGDPQFVKIPKDYKQKYAEYTTTNRIGQEQVATILANDVAVSSYKEGNTAKPGSILVMEIYKVIRDSQDKAVTSSDGSYVKGDLAAVAVMERQSNWPDEFPADHRIKGWGFAIYNPDGTEKENELPCVACHAPLKNNDFIFSFDAIKEYANSTNP